MKHTPGPWAATTRKGSWDWVVFKKNDPRIGICQMFHDGTELNEIGKANSLLIASAPELLQALKDITSYEYRSERVICQSPSIPKCMCNKCIDERVKAAIAKAQEK